MQLNNSISYNYDNNNKLSYNKREGTIRMLNKFATKNDSFIEDNLNNNL